MEMSTPFFDFFKSFFILRPVPRILCLFSLLTQDTLTILPISPQQYTGKRRNYNPQNDIAYWNQLLFQLFH